MSVHRTAKGEAVEIYHEVHVYYVCVEKESNKNQWFLLTHQ